MKRPTRRADVLAATIRDNDGIVEPAEGFAVRGVINELRVLGCDFPNRADKARIVPSSQSLPHLSGFRFECWQCG